MTIYQRLLKYLKPYIWPYFSLAMVCMIAFSATGGAIPFLVQSIFDDVFSQKDQAALFYLPLVIIGVFALRGLMNFGQSYLTSYVGLRVIQDIRNALNHHMQYMSLSFFQRHPTGTLIS
ncbi:MAG: ABC transporter transmembrane domain-containing protein, partial [Candidatus Binatia bacterium]